MNRLLLASSAAVLCLSGCGGDDPAQVAAPPVVIAPAPAPAPAPTPAPEPPPAPPPTPAPPPSPSYGMLFDEARDQSYAADVVEQFYLDGLTYSNSECAPGYAAPPLSDGLNIGYTATGRHYVLALGSTNQQFTQGDLTVADEHTRAMRNGVGALFSRTNLIGSTFQYLNLVEFASDGQGITQNRTGAGRYKRYAAFGNRTLATDVPTTSVGYTVLLGGTQNTCYREDVIEQPKSTQSIDFAAKTFSWRLSAGAGNLGVDLRFDGLIDAGNRIRGGVYQLHGSLPESIGDFQGHLFGPNAREVAFVWNTSKGQGSQSENRRGYVVGMRTP